MAAEPAKIYRVAELNGRLRAKLERWGEVWVEGEIADMTRSNAGHLYFTLDDGAAPAQLRAVMFRGDAQLARARMENGARVRLCARFSVYEPRGTLQMIARLALPAGEGDRREQLERLKKKLAAEGLFAPERKRGLPRLPRVVGLVTSAQGAALHDVVRVASHRAPVRLVVSHCLVQGPDAPRAIVAALRRVVRVRGLDVIILTRGGGASEDLSAFNDEGVARAIAACPVPVVSGVGHEIDSTIADLVADVRAATPSNAAEIVVPDANALYAELDAHRRHLEQALAMHVGRQRLVLERLARRSPDPRRQIARAAQALRQVTSALERSAARARARERAALTALTRALARHEPRAAVARDRAHHAELDRRLHAAARRASEAPRRALEGLCRELSASVGPRLAVARQALARADDALLRQAPLSVATRRAALAALDARLRRASAPAQTRARARLGTLVARLDALSPLAVLGRGYAIALHARSGRALLDASEAAVGDALELRLAAGHLAVRVEAVHAASIAPRDADRRSEAVHAASIAPRDADRPSDSSPRADDAAHAEEG